MTYQPAGLNRCLIACYEHFVKLAFCAGFAGSAGQEGYQVLQEGHTSRFPTGLGFIDTGSAKFGSFWFLYLNLVLHGSFEEQLKQSYLCECFYFLYMGLERVPTLKWPVDFCGCI